MRAPGAIAVARVGDAGVEMRFGPVGALHQAGFERLGAVGVVAAEQAQVAQAEAGVAPFRRVLIDARVEFFGPLAFALLLQHQRQIPQYAGLARVDIEGAFIAGARAGQVVQFLLRHAQVEVRLRAARLEAGGLLVRLRGLFVAAHLVAGDAQVEPVLEAVGRGLRQCAAVARGSDVVAVLEGQGGQGFGGRRRIRLDFGQHLRVAAHADVSFFSRNIATRFESASSHLRIARQHLAILLHGFGMLARLLQRDRLAE